MAHKQGVVQFAALRAGVADSRAGSGARIRHIVIPSAARNLAANARLLTFEARFLAALGMTPTRFFGTRS